MVVSRKMQALDQAIIRHLGIEPTDVPILALKSSVHFRADLHPIAEIVVALAPGPVVADPATLPFKHVQPACGCVPTPHRHRAPAALYGAPCRRTPRVL